MTVIRIDAKPKATHCQRGHEFTPENTYVDPDGWRNCRACRKVRRRVTVEVTCPDCGSVTRVRRAVRPDRTFPQGTCRSCAMKRVAANDLVLPALDAKRPEGDWLLPEERLSPRETWAAMTPLERRLLARAFSMFDLSEISEEEVAA